jgi:SEC-C motif domain protein
MKFIVTKSCPCRALDPVPLAYAQCCQPWHGGWASGVRPATPEQLMRSRYSAYALAHPNYPDGQAMLQYLLATWHVSTVPDDLELSPTQWLGLQVVHTEQTDQAGIVEFIARYKVDGKAHQLHEVSRFVVMPAGSAQVAQWVYIDGDVRTD